MDFDFEWDPTAFGIAALVTLLVFGSMFGVIPSFGDWTKVPFSTRAIFAVLTGPVMYMIIVYMMNK